MNRRTFALALATLAAAPTALAQSNGLDGRKFHGVFLEKGRVEEE